MKIIKQNQNLVPQKLQNFAVIGRFAPHFGQAFNELIVSGLSHFAIHSVALDGVYSIQSYDLKVSIELRNASFASLY